MTSLFAWREVDPAAVRAAAWIARCVGRGEAAPLRREDLAVLAADLELRPMEPGQVVFAAGRPPKGVWIVRGGLVELAVGAGRRRAVVALLRPGDVDGDIQLLLRLARSQARLLGLLGGSLAEQAARLLLDEAGDGDVVVLPQRTLAAMLGVQRPSLNKVLRQFEEQGLLELSYRSVRILDPAGLKRHSRSHA